MWSFVVKIIGGVFNKYLIVQMSGFFFAVQIAECTLYCTLYSLIQ